MIDYRTSFQDRLRAVGERVRRLRLARNLRQQELADHAGIGPATLARFERTGHASLETALRIATALAADAAFDKLFEPPPYASIDEALTRSEAAERKRAPRRKR
jgi:transcriptional regulator with XRE-family HTH domain